MPSAKKQNKKQHKSVALFSLFLIMIMLFAGNAAAISIGVGAVTSQDSTIVGERYYQTKVTIICSNDEQFARAKGIIELGLTRNSATPFLSVYTSSQPPCESTFPWNTHFSYECDFIAGSSSTTVTLTGHNIPDGTYYPIITHATACFNNGGQPKEPYGYGKRIPGSSAIVFGQSSGNAADQCDNPYEALQYLKSKGQVQCYEAICNNAASTSSTAQCVKNAVCVDGGQQWATCLDGKSVAIRTCYSGEWHDTGTVCSGIPNPPTPLPVVPNTPILPGLKDLNFNAIIMFGIIIIFVFFLLRKSKLVRF